MICFDKTIRMRSRRLEVEKIPCHDLESVGNYVLVESNKWKGLRNESGILLLTPIYDDIDVMADINMCILKLRDTYILYDLLSKNTVDLPLMNAYHRYGYVLEVMTKNGAGLFSCRLRKMLIPPHYIETTHIDSGRYLWVKMVDDDFGFYDTQTSIVVKCPKGTSLCLECDEDYMFVVVDNEVKCINQSGIFDSGILRRFALENGGRVKLCNHNANSTIIADIYGHIIN